jgi:hypothetical protein
MPPRKRPNIRGRLFAGRSHAVKRKVRPCPSGGPLPRYRPDWARRGRSIPESCTRSTGRGGRLPTASRRSEKMDDNRLTVGRRRRRPGWERRRDRAARHVVVFHDVSVAFSRLRVFAVTAGEVLLTTRQRCRRPLLGVRQSLEQKVGLSRARLCQAAGLLRIVQRAQLAPGDRVGQRE